ncbi:MAG: glycosyltransferase family 2 protein [Proteobacteria bacterium]|nr:glycosyltransferase family 2 protein [Pseudomonadota bacterium]MBU1686562.1 glycosyltransferase family 2 protein [Pseudomonadota bacterium]
MYDISVSIVTFSPSAPQLTDTLASLARSFESARSTGHCRKSLVVLVDNGPDPDSLMVIQESARLTLEGCSEVDLQVITGQGNVGFGQGHNLAITANSTYHLILNPDVILEEDALAMACVFMDEHPEVGLISPHAVSPDGRQQYLCKRYPSLLTLALRAWAPAGIKKLFDRRLSAYEMRSECESGSPFINPPIVSGCFMFFRTKLFLESGMFSPDYFLYFEDFDLSLRVGERSRLAYVPQVRITHHGGSTAQKGFSHVGMFTRSGKIFFQKHGIKIW